MYDKGHKGVSWCLDETDVLDKKAFVKERGRIERCVILYHKYVQCLFICRYFAKVKRKFPKFRMGYIVDIEDHDSVSRYNDEWLAANIFVSLNFLAKQDVNKSLGKGLRDDMITLYDPSRHLDPNTLF